MDFVKLTWRYINKFNALVIVDQFSKWVEIFPAGNPDATAVAKALCRHIVPSFGIPEKIYCDNGTHFVNTVVSKMSQSLGMQVKYHCASFEEENCNY